MFRNFMKFKNIKETLQPLVEQRVAILLESGQRLRVEVDAVVDDVLVASINGKILFINIECICAVIACCDEALESLLAEERSLRRHEEEGDSLRHAEDFFKEVSRKSEEEESRKHRRL